MAFSDSDFVKLNLPDGVSFDINGTGLSLDDAITASLDETGSRFLCLAQLFTMLESDHLQSEKIKYYSYSKWGLRGSDYWRLQASGAGMDGTPPNVIMRPSQTRGGYYPW